MSIKQHINFNFELAVTIEYILLYNDGLGIGWQDAENYCIDNYRSHLASLHSPSDNDSLVQLRDNNGLSGNIGWIGLSDVDEENNWVWSDGSPYNYSHFSEYEPNGGSSENCVNVVIYGDLGRWNDNPCTGNVLVFWCNANCMHIYMLFMLRFLVFLLFLLFVLNLVVVFLLCNFLAFL